MAARQGPAVYFHNNAVFSPHDFRNLCKIGQGSKLDHLGKTGKFGLGFNAVRAARLLPMPHARSVYSPYTHLRFRCTTLLISHRSCLESIWSISTRTHRSFLALPCSIPVSESSSRGTTSLTSLVPPSPIVICWCCGSVNCPYCSPAPYIATVVGVDFPTSFARIFFSAVT